MIVLSPEGKAQTSVMRMAALPRFLDLHAKIVGLLDNSKPNADKLQERLAELLKERVGVSGVVARRKITAQQGAPSNTSMSWPLRPISSSAVWEIEAPARRGVSTTQSNFRSAADLLSP